MKVSDVLRIMAERDPNEHIYIEWWDRELFEYDAENPIPDEAWKKACEEAQNNPNEWAMQTIFEQIEDALQYRIDKERRESK